MTVQELNTKIEKKQAQIAKLTRLYEKYAASDAEEKSIIDRFLITGDRKEYHEYLRAHSRSWGGDAWSKANDLYDANQTLAKYQKALEAAQAKENTLNDIPEVLKKFREDLIERWDRYDEWKQNAIREDMHKEHEMEYKEYKRMMREKWGLNYWDFLRKTAEELHKSNVKDAENLVLNLIERTVEIAGKITDAQALRLDRDNNGYAIINGYVTGEKGKARVESIGAGGYNIQRYHIRVLVKEVR